MLRRIFIKSESLYGLCRSYNKSISRVKNSLYSNLQISICNKGFAKTSSVLFSAQSNPKEKTNEKFDEKQNENYNSFQHDTDTKNTKTFKNNKTEETNSTDESILGKELEIHRFANTKTKEKEAFLECIRMYKNQPGRRKDRIPFIYSALKYMEEFGVHEDLQVYKQLIDIFPKESMIPTNVFQTFFMHYPKEQFCCIAILEQMENNGIIPDSDTELMLLNIFGQHGLPLLKYWKMMYWMPKFKNLNPWPVPKPIPDDAFELAKLAMIKISSVDSGSLLTVFDTKDIPDSIDKTWIVSAMSPIQSELLLKHDKNFPIYVEGPFKIYVAIKCIDYFTLRANPIKDRKFPDYDPDDVKNLRNPYIDTHTSDIILAPTIHEQFDGTIFANCATGMSTKDSLLSWIRCLQKENPVLAEIPIVFTLKNFSQEKLYLEESTEKVSNIDTSKEDRTKQIQ